MAQTLNLQPLKQSDMKSTTKIHPSISLFLFFEGRGGGGPGVHPSWHWTRGVTYLFWWQYGNIVLIDGARFLLDGALVDFLFEVFAGQPEQHVLLAVLRPQELPENIPACRVPHQLVKGLRPEPDLFHWGFGAEVGRVERWVLICLFTNSFILMCMCWLTGSKTPEL